MYRIGFGFDAHRLVEGKSLVLGGVEIPFERGLDGHSDADVLTHAVCDAVLGALGEGDIGTKFPDSDPAYKGISSLVLLEKVLLIMHKKGFGVLNLDCVIICESPKISPHVDQLKESLSSIIQISGEQIGIKATTTDGMGFTGRGEGIASKAAVLLKRT